MKTIFQGITILFLVSMLMCTTMNANTEDTREAFSAEEQERMDIRKAQRAESMEAKIERKKESIRTRMEARGIAYDEIEEHIEEVFSRFETLE